MTTNKKIRIHKKVAKVERHHRRDCSLLQHGEVPKTCKKCQGVGLEYVYDRYSGSVFTGYRCLSCGNVMYPLSD